MSALSNVFVNFVQGEKKREVKSVWEQLQEERETIDRVMQAVRKKDNGERFKPREFVPVTQKKENVGNERFPNYSPEPPKPKKVQFAQDEDNFYLVIRKGKVTGKERLF